MKIKFEIAWLLIWTILLIPPVLFFISIPLYQTVGVIIFVFYSGLVFVGLNSEKKWIEVE